MRLKRVVSVGCSHMHTTHTLSTARWKPRWQMLGGTSARYIACSEDSCVSPPTHVVCPPVCPHTPALSILLRAALPCAPALHKLEPCPIWTGVPRRPWRMPWEAMRSHIIERAIKPNVAFELQLLDSQSCDFQKCISLFNSHRYAPVVTEGK